VNLKQFKAEFQRQFDRDAALGLRVLKILGSYFRETTSPSLRRLDLEPLEEGKSHAAFNTDNKARQKEGFRRFCGNLLREKKYSEEKLVQLNRLKNFSTMSHTGHRSWCSGF